MSRLRSKWFTAALTAATAGLWATAIAGPPRGLDRDDVSDCRGLGIMAGVALIVWLIAEIRIRRVEDRQDATEKAWRLRREALDAEAGAGSPAPLRPASGRGTRSA